MLTRLAARSVAACVRHALVCVVLFALLAVAATVFVATRFSIDTDSSKLLSPTLAWRQSDLALDRAFPHRTDQLVAVLDGGTPEAAESAATRLEAALQHEPAAVRTAQLAGGGAFFDKNGVLFQSLAEVRATAAALVSAQPFLASLAVDPSLRGILDTLSQAADGIRRGRATFADLRPAVAAIADALERLSRGQDARFSWRQIITGTAPGPLELRRFIAVQPVLDYADLEPGRRASARIRAVAEELGITERNGLRLRLTGAVALSDEEFGTLADGAGMNGLATLACVVVILFLALRQARIILPVLLTVIVGLVFTAALGLAMVGAFNPISVAFAVLFVGLGVDFGIQFAVRYRQEKHVDADTRGALATAAAALGNPLLLAAASIALAFWSFLPTAYRGLSELGLIAGVGMGVAFVTTLSLLPALIMLFQPGVEPREIGFAWAAPADALLERRGRWIVGLTLLCVCAGLPLLGHVRFDSNPLDLRSSRTESVATALELLGNADTSTTTIEILAPDLQQAMATAARLRALPQVAHALTLQSFVPDDQAEKLAALDDANFFLQDTLNPADVKDPPSAAATLDALVATAAMLRATAAGHDDPAAADMARLAHLFAALAEGPETARQAAEAALTAPLAVTLKQTRDILEAAAVTRDSLPADLVRQWIADDGRARIEVAPRANPNDDAALRAFVRAVQAVTPEATGAAVGFVESANTIVTAFLQAAALSLVAIAGVLFLALRRWRDVLLTLVPLLVAAIVTLEICALIGLQLNFANIIALPLMLGVGVAFKIYYIMAWRAGERHFLQSGLTRAVLFSAATTATAFGSLFFSHHPGTSSMGALLSISLIATLAAAVFFQPALLATQTPSAPADGTPPE